MILAALAVTTIGAGLMTTRVFAENAITDTNPMSMLAQRISEKFGLKQEEVQSVVDQLHQEQQATRQAEMKTRQEERLSQLVTDGKITTEQKDRMLKKMAEMQANQQNAFGQMKDLSPEERKALQEKHRAELEAWATENNINIQYLMMGNGRGERGMGGFGKPFNGNNK